MPYYFDTCYPNFRKAVTSFQISGEIKNTGSSLQ
jgi:hypothetical protein